MDHKSRVVRLLYFSGLALWTMYVVLNPPWVGTAYNQDDYNQPASWSQGGVFGLAGAEGFFKRAPVWSPPAAHSPGIETTVRWPWQRISDRHHVELSLSELAKLLSYGLITLGLLAGLLSFVRLTSRDDRVVTFAWSVALCLIISWIAIVVLSVASMGYATTPAMVTSLLTTGVVGGLIYGFVSHSRQVARRTGSPPATGKLVEGDLVGPKKMQRERSWKPGRISLLLFVIGLVISCVIAWTAIDVAIAISPSRLLGTNVDGFGEVSGWMRVLTGVGIAVLGWLLGIMLWWATWIRGFAVGLMTGASALGFLCIMWH